MTDKETRNDLICYIKEVIFPWGTYQIPVDMYREYLRHEILKTLTK